jgi:hypothetical protein
LGPGCGSRLNLELLTDPVSHDFGDLFGVHVWLALVVLELLPDLVELGFVECPGGQFRG